MSSPVAPVPELFSTYVFDLDGVIYLGEQAIPGASDSIAALQAAGKAVYFLTNNSSQTRESYQSKLRRMGITAELAQIYTSAYATALYLKERACAGKSAFVIGEAGVRAELADVGLNIVADPGTADPSTIDYVVVGIDRSFTYAKLLFAHACIKQGAAFLATNRDSTYPSEGGEVPGAGSIVISIATATDQEPVTIGKPEPEALLEILRASGSSADQALMVGDRLDTDIALGVRAGVRTALVLTGVTNRAQAESAADGEKPTWIIQTLAELMRRQS